MIYRKVPTPQFTQPSIVVPFKLLNFDVLRRKLFSLKKNSLKLTKIKSNVPSMTKIPVLTTIMLGSAFVALKEEIKKNEYYEKLNIPSEQEDVILTGALYTLVKA